MARAARVLTSIRRQDRMISYRSCHIARLDRRASAPTICRAGPSRYYRPEGSPDIRRLIDDGFQAFNAARLSEACRIYRRQDARPEHDTMIGLDGRRRADARRARRLYYRADGARADRLLISTGANLYHDLHYALNFTLRRGSPFVDDLRAVRARA